MSEKKTILAELTERRDEVLLKLRDREPDLYAEMIELNAAISGINAESARVIRQDEYSEFRKPSKAIYSYLERVQKPIPKETMAKEVVDGGFRGTDDPYWDLIRATYYQVKKGKLIEKDGLIGKPDWQEEWFNAKEAATP